MNIIVACEYSARVRDAFLARGHYAWSCDLLPTDGDPENHYIGNILDGLDYETGGFFESIEWDLMVAHPPCTYLTGAAEWAFADNPMIKGKPRNIKAGTLVGAERRQAREDALDFIKKLWELPIPRICIENPVGIITRRLPELGKPQYVHPYNFNDDASKKTGLWLKGLPPLKQTKRFNGRIVEHNGKIVERWSNQTDSGQNKLPPSEDRWKLRSYTYQGIADAMAGQWG